MAPRSAIDKLPESVLKELNKKLIDQAFSDYQGLTDWLKSKGYKIGKTAVWEHGSAIQASMKKAMDRALYRMEIAKALSGASDEDKAALMEANEIVAMDQIMDMFEAMSNWKAEDKVSAVPKLVRAIADLNRSAIGSSKWKREFEAEARRLAREEAAQAAARAAKAEGVSEQGIARIREALGMVG
jgi:hypothetical protein